MSCKLVAPEEHWATLIPDTANPACPRIELKVCPFRQSSLPPQRVFGQPSLALASLKEF